jgi:cysteine synthase B
MIAEGIHEGRLHKGQTILDSTSGNTGIAYAMIGAALGYRVKLCVPANASNERKRMLQAYGAEVIYTPAGEGSDGAFRRVREIYEQDPDAYFYPDQYNNPANWRAHYQTTAVEILEQTDGEVTDFIAAVGTSGTCMGTTRRLRKEKTSVRCYTVQPDSPFHGLEGLKHMETAIKPGIYDENLADRNFEIATEHAHAMVRRVARTEGLLIGVSAGANLVAARQLAREMHSRGEDGTIVTVICDGAAKYLTEHFWDDHD